MDLVTFLALTILVGGGAGAISVSLFLSRTSVRGKRVL